MIVLTDSSPWITLARAKLFKVLHEFYGEIVVSHEVYKEVVIDGAGLPGSDEMQTASWIRIESAPTEPAPAIKLAFVALGAGERSIIYLASALKADLVLMDERRATRRAFCWSQRGWFDRYTRARR